MKKLTNRILLLTTIVLSTLMLGACDLRMSNNGHLDGFWQLMTVAEGGAEAVDVHEQRIFWCVEFDLLEVYNTRNSYKYLFRFDRKGNTLAIHDPYLDMHLQGSFPVTDPKDMYHVYIRHLSEHYNVERLDGKAMILSNDSIRMTFRRY